MIAALGELYLDLLSAESDGLSQGDVQLFLPSPDVTTDSNARPFVCCREVVRLTGTTPHRIERGVQELARSMDSWWTAWSDSAMAILVYNLGVDNASMVAVRR